MWCKILTTFKFDIDNDCNMNMPFHRISWSSAWELTGKASWGKTKDSTPLVSWSNNNADFLIDQVTAHRAEAGNGMNFKWSFWQSVADWPKLAQLEKEDPQSRAACKEKWSHVSSLQFSIWAVGIIDNHCIPAQGNIWSCQSPCPFCGLCMFHPVRGQCWR